MSKKYVVYISDGENQDSEKIYVVKVNNNVNLPNNPDDDDLIKEWVENNFGDVLYYACLIDGEAEIPHNARCLEVEWVNGKCRGYQRSEYDDEPAEMCKECTDSMFYENE